MNDTTTRVPLARVADRILGTPLLITPEKASTVLAVLGGRIGVDVTGLNADGAVPAPRANRLETDLDEAVPAGGETAISFRRRGATALVTVSGSLVNRGAWLGTSSGLQSYEGIAAELRAAAASDAVERIVLDVDSPGGEAGGLFRLAETIRAVRARTPVVAYVDDLAASAAYGIAASANEVVVSPTSTVGSIGVVLVHADHSAELAAQGVRPTLIFAGARKVDGNPFEPLPDSVRDDLQERVDGIYGRFLEVVGAGRPRLGADGARATEAATYLGEAAVRAGLADRIGSLDAIVNTGRRRAAQTRRSVLMHDEENGAAAAPAVGSQVGAEASGAADPGVAETARAEGARAERERLAAILADERVSGRERAAMDLALKAPSMAAGDVAAFVADNVAPAGNTDAAAWTAERLADAGPAGLTLPSEPVASVRAAGTKIDVNGIYAARRTS